METIDVRIDSLSPLLMACWPIEDEPDSSAVPVHKKPVLNRREIAEKAAYRCKDGQLCLPGPAFMSLLRAAGKSYKAKGRRQTLGGIIPAAVRVLEEQVRLSNGHPIHDFEVDTRHGVNRSTKGGLTIHRPRIEVWGARFTLEIEDDLIEPSDVHMILSEGGRRYGVGAFRPACGGPFGRFMVSEWKTKRPKK